MESIWTGEKLPHFPALWGDIHTDVLVVGGGIAGLLCAYHLKEAGIPCILAERGKIAGGNTRFTTAKITAQHGLCYDRLLRRFGTENAQLFLQANLAAIERYETLSREFPCDFSRQDHFVYARTGVQKLETELSALEKLGYPGEFVRELPLPFPTAGAVRFPDQAQFHPLKFLRQIGAQLTIYEDTPVLRLEPGSAVTEHGRIFFQKAIVATHFPILNRHGLYFLKLYQSRSYVMALAGLPKVYGMYLDESEKGLSIRGAGDTMLLGGGGHRTGKRGAGWAGLENAAHQYFPQGKILGRWAAQDCMTLDGMPYAGLYSPNTPDLYVATGFHKWGMTGAMVCAQLLTSLIQERDHPCRELLSPNRRMARPQLFINGWESAMGLLSPLPRRCPHMGCALRWNRQEHTWDCPCHGSRFKKNGSLLDGPAMEGLGGNHPAK